MSLYTPKYTSLEAVKQALKEKVMFSNTNEKYMSDNQVLANIKVGEASIEKMFSRQYIIVPGFIGENDEPFHEIPEDSTIQYIQELCMLRTCILIIRKGFAVTEGVRGDGFIKNFTEQWNDLIYDVLGKDRESGQWLYPPFPGLKQDIHSSFYEKGIPFPRTATIGIASPSIARGVVNRLTNPIRNWWFGNRCNTYGNW